MAHTTLVGMLREDGVAKSMATVMKEIVLATNAPEETRRKLREQIDNACSSRKTTESTRNAEEFKFKVPKHTLEDWKAILRVKKVEPMKEVHYKTEYGVNYVNVNEDSWTENEEAEAWKAADQAKEEWDSAEREKTRNRGQVGADEYEIKEMPTEKHKAIYDETRRKVREANRYAKLQNPTWEIAQRTQNNDSTYEDKELRFKERDEKSRRDDNRDTDWYQNVRNIAELGEQLGYTERHYKNVLSRFISWFNPELTIVTEKQTADETARFLLRLHTPDTEEEKLEKQMNRLTRKAGTPLRSVMAFLYEIVKAKCKNSSLGDQETEIRKEMVRGLVKFTRGDLQVQLVQSIEYARKKREKLDWRVLMERAIEAEILQGMPQTDIKYLNPDADEAALHKLYNVCIGIDSKPQSKPYYEPGKGGKPRTEEEQDRETEIKSPDYSDYLGDYPSTTELTKEIKKGIDSGSKKKARKGTEYESAEEFESEPENLDKLRIEKEIQMKKLEQMIKNSEYMQTRQNARNKKEAAKLGVHNTVTEQAKKTTTDNKDNSKPQYRQRTPSRDNSRDRTNSRDRNANQDRVRNRDDRNRQPDRRDSRSRDRTNSRDRGNNRDRNGNRSRDRDNRDRNSNRNRDRQPYRSWDRKDSKDQNRDRTQSRDRDTRNRNGDTRDRGRSRERRQERTTRTNYASTDRMRSSSRQREFRNRSDSRNKRERGITRKDFEDLRGVYFRRDYIFDSNRPECNKCGSWGNHHPWNCNKYNKYAPNQCTVCNKGLHHWEVDCMGSFRDPETPYVRGKVERRYESRERTPERYRRQPSRDRREEGQNGRQNRTPSREREGQYGKFAREAYNKNEKNP